MMTIRNSLQEEDIYPGDELLLDVLLRDRVSDIFEV